MQGQINLILQRAKVEETYNRLYTPDARNYIIYEHLLLCELFELL